MSLPDGVTMEDYEEFLATLTEEEKASFADMAVEAQGLCAPLPGPQTEAYNTEAYVCGYGGAAGGGKAETVLSLRNIQKYSKLFPNLSKEEIAMKLGSYVYTPFGKKLIEDIKVGDRVCCPDGTLATIIKKSPVHRRPCYTVTTLDGGTVTVSDEHLWSVKKSGCRTRRSRKDDYPLNGMVGKQRFSNEIVKRYKTVTTETLKRYVDEARERGREGTHRPYWPSIPMTEPVEFTAPVGRRRLIPAYTLGVLIGDGSLGGTPMWTKPDFELAEYVREEVESLGDKVNTLDDTMGKFSVVGGEIKSRLKVFGLVGAKSNTKFIPPYYLHAPLKVRARLLQGLMDTDGHADKRGHASYVTVSKQLSEDVKYLASSLGYSATVSIKEEPKYEYNGESRIGQRAYVIYITGRNRSNLFRTSVKRDRMTELNHESGRKVVSVELVDGGDYDCQCIMIDHPLHLYLTNDFIVTHNTFLAITLAMNEHQKTLYIRKEAAQLQGVKDEIAQILNTTDGFKSQIGVWNLPLRGSKKKRQIRFGGVNNPGDEMKYQGAPRDLLVIDEACNIPEHQVRFLMGWVRTADPSQRCRVLMCTNPPTDLATGQWFIQYFAPWIDENHPNKAASGEIRWFASVDGRDIEVADSTPFDHEGDTITPQSRTFIHAKVTDNPYLMGTNYYTTLQALPEPLRSQMLYGDFLAGVEDNRWQVIPTDWVKQAQARWEPRPSEKRPYKGKMTALGVDVSRGGRDESVIARLHGTWYDELICIPGAEVPDGPTLGAEILKVRRDGAVVHVDAIGVGTSVVDFLYSNRIDHVPVTGSERGVGQDSSSHFTYRNKRAQLWWEFREMLDPKNGSQIALPPDPALLSDLTAPRFTVMEGNVIKVETKIDIIKRLGRSPDRGDTVVYASNESDMSTGLQDAAYGSSQGQTPKVHRSVG